MVRFELFELHIEDMDPFMAGGISIEDKDDVERITSGHTHEAIDYIWKDHEIDFTIEDPKDHMVLHEARRISREERRLFTIICFGRDERNELVPVHQLDGCIFTEGNRELIGKEEIKPEFSGYALRSRALAAQFD